LRSLILAALAIGLSAAAGGFAYFIPAAVVAWNSISPVLVPSPSPTGLLGSPSSSPSPVAQQGAFTVLLLGSDDDSKFSPDHVLTQSMILVRVLPATKR
jgi:hypothetical protein